MTTIVLEDLTPEEKLELIDTLWASLAAEDFLLTPEQMKELDRRIELDEPGEPWDEVKARLLARLR